MAKLSVNLLQAELLPEKPLWTLQRVVLLWGIVLIAMISWLSISQWQVNRLSSEFSQLSQQQRELQQRQSELELEVAKNKADPVLMEKLNTMKLLLANKKNLQQQLTDSSSTYAAGFAQAMTELSSLHHKDISLARIQMQGDDIRFEGTTRSAKSVPAWLAAFESSTFLSGRAFKQFSLADHEGRLTRFVISSSRQEGGQ